ncbi:MAG: methylenetetrahydrofolate reductase [NAD(P)H] [Lachnospiraceae bacterium]|nr:methylenetetrahydrofolate reductase [NAD(P)H] [Lachnospiraceae bacterium]
MAKISEILSTEKPTLSFEVFPPKTEDKYEGVEKAALDIATLHPSFISVTYGANGGTRRYTSDIAGDIAKNGVPSLAHLTCVASNKESVDEALKIYKEKGIENILALRGDLPENTTEMPADADFHHASDLTAYIKSKGDFCIGGACYPEGHPEAANKDGDILNIKKKVEAGCEFLTTQMFFENSIMFNYMYRLREAGVMVPVCAGIMPITNANQVKRSIQLSGSVMPPRFLALVDKFGDNPKAMKQAGIAYATDQIIDLIANGIHHIHVYSMNKPEVAEAIAKNLSDIVVL